MSDIPAADLPPPEASVDLPPSERYTFNLPPGSVRGLLVLMIMVPFWLMLAWPGEQRLLSMPFYLYFLLGWVFLFLFTPTWNISTDQAATDTPAEFRLPRYLFHFILVAITLAAAAWRVYRWGPADLIDRLKPDPAGVARAPFFLLSLAIGFFPGWALSRIGRVREVYWFQDVQAAVSLIAMLGLTILTITHIISGTQQTELHTDILEYIVIGIVAWYFGARAPRAYTFDPQAQQSAAFGWPPGSVRAILVLLIMIPIWLMLALGRGDDVHMPFSLYLLLGFGFLFLFTPVLFPTPTTRGELGLWRYSVHVLIGLVTIGLLAWRIVKRPESLVWQLQPDPNEGQDRLPWFLVALFAGFLPAWILAEWKWLPESRGFLNFQAVVAILAMLGLAGLAVARILAPGPLDSIVPPEKANLIEYVLVGIVAWYFGERAPGAYPTPAKPKAAVPATS